MKKIRLVSAFVLGYSLLSYHSFGQNQQITHQQSVGIQNSTQTYPVSNSNQFNQRPVPGNVGNTSLNASFQQTSSSQVPAGQHTCKTFELNQKHYQERGIQQEFNQGYINSAQSMANYYTPKTPGVNEISIIFHVVHNPNNPAENVSNALIMQVYNDIVEDFQMLNLDPVRSGFGFTPANPNINFCLATQDPMGNPLPEVGVIRVSTTENWYDSDNGEENKMKSSATGGSQIWDRNNYLNVWICDISNGASSGTAGYAYRPNTSFLPGANIDGIVIDYNLGMNNENILTHEIGHYLGLDHTWGGSGGCSNDDGFADTPVTDGPSFNYPGSCSSNQQTCPGTQTQFENFMDYANCTSMFTQQQANYMLNILQGIRGSLLLSPGCDPTNTPPNSAFTSNPSDPTQVTIPQNASISFIDQSINAPTGWTWTISGTQGVDWAWINSTNQNSQNPIAEFYTVGTYTVSLTASNAFGSDLTPAVKNAYVNVVSAATGNSCDTLRNYIPTQAGTGVYGNTGGGYLAGNANFSPQTALEWAEPYNASSSTQVRALEFYASIVSNGGGSITFKVYNDNGGIPGTVQASEVVPLADIDEGFWNNIVFTTPASVTGAFWVGYELSYGTGDTLALPINLNGALPNNFTWVKASTNGWLNAGTVYGGIRLAFVMDVLTSNGTAPAADFNTSSWEICTDGNIQVDGSVSTNTNSYQWYVTDDPVTTLLDESTSSSNIFNFPYSAGDYRIILYANGSCLSDGIYLPVTIFSDITATVTPTATTCGNNDGIITITSPTGGGSSTYYYSIDGINYQSSNVFNNLAPGSYTVSIGSIDALTGNTLGSGCVTTYTVNVGSSSTISPTVSSNASICPGGSTTITAGGGTGYSWYNGATLIANTASTTVSPATTTQYSCVVTSGGCSATVYTTVTVRTPPVAPTITPSGSTTICTGQDVDLTSSYPTGNTWSTNETSSTITVSTAGPFTVTYTDAYGCVSAASSPVNITVTSGPVINSGIVSNPSTCATATGSIQVTGTGTGNITWTGTTPGSQTGVTLPYTISNLAAGSYDITFTSGGCTSGTLTVGLTDPTPPTTPIITPGGPTTFCAGGSVTLTSSQASGNVWSTNAGSATTQAVTATATGNYTVTYTDGNGCSATSAPIAVTVNNNPTPPTITPGGPTTFCTGGSVTLTSSQGSGNTWSANAGSATTQAVTATATGNYTVTYTNGNGCSATSAPIAVTVNNNPASPTITPGGPTTFCAGGSVTLTSSQTSGNVWSANAGSATTQAVTATATGNYTVTYTDGNGCSATSAPIAVTVNNNPAPPTITPGGSTTFCTGGSVTLTSSQASGNVWSANAGSATTQAVTATATGNYTVTYTDGNGCSATSAPIAVTVNNNPAPPTITPGGSTTFCAGGSVTLTSSQASGNVWSANAGSATTQAVTATATGNYTVTYTDGNGCSATSAAAVVTVNPLPTISEGTLTPPTTCGTATGSIQVNGSGTGNISWTGTASSSATGVSLPYTITGLATGSYNITFEDVNGCTSTVLTSNLTDPSQTTPTFTQVAAICTGGNFTLPTTSNNSYTGTWSPAIDNTTTTTYTFTPTAGQCASTTTMTVTVNPLPTVTQSALGTVCVYNSPITLTGGSPASGTYSGTGVSGGMFNPATAGTGTHTITYTYTDGNNCSNTATTDIIVDGCLSISENNLTDVKVYPNPTQHNLTIEVSGDFNYEILDTKGRIIEKGNGIDKVDVKTSEYTSGVYFVSLTSETVNTMIRVMKN